MKVANNCAVSFVGPLMIAEVLMWFCGETGGVFDSFSLILWHGGRDKPAVSLINLEVIMSNESMSRPLVSVVTVTFNARAGLEVTLESVRSQSWGDWEHLVVDGGSHDGTAELAFDAMAADKRVRAWSEPDRGLYDAMNKGLARARGEYVLFLNAGDTFHDSEALERIAREALKDRPPTIYGQTRLVSGVKERADAGERHLRAPRRLTWRSLKWGMLVCHQAMAVRRDIAGEYDLRYRFSADYDWMIRCLRQGGDDNRYIDGWLIDYLDEGVTTANHKASLKERFDIMCRHYGRAGTLARHGWFAVRDLARKAARLLKHK